MAPYCHLRIEVETIVNLTRWSGDPLEQRAVDCIRLFAAISDIVLPSSVDATVTGPNGHKAAT